MSYSQLLRIPAFRNLWLGQAISQFGDAFYYVVFAFMVERITHDIKWVGVVGAMETIPYLLFSAHAGVLADRFDRKRIMLLSDLASAAILVLFGFWLIFDSAPNGIILATVPFLLSAVRVFFMPAKGAALPALVETEHLQAANAFSMMTQSLMPMLGLAMSASVLGVLYKAFPDSFFLACVAVNLVSFLGSAFFIAQLPKILPDRKDLHEFKALDDFKKGYAFIRGRRDLMVFMTLLTGFRLTVAPYFIVFVATNKHWFDGTPQTLSWLELSFFAGMVISLPIVGRLKLKRPGMAFSLGLGYVAVAVSLLAFVPYVQPWAPDLKILGYGVGFWFFTTWNFSAGLAVPAADVPITTYMQLSVPDEFRGRVNSVINMIATGVMPIGMAIGGIMVDKVGLMASYFIMGAGMIISALGGLLDRTYRNITMPVAAEAAPAVEEVPVLHEQLASELVNH